MPKGSDTYLTDVDVRIWLRDNDPEANLLIKDLEFTPEEIRTAFTLAVDYWNDQPPYIGAYDYNRFPWRSQLLRGVAGNLLYMAARGYDRNSLTYNAGGLSVQDQDKAQSYDAASARLTEAYHDWVIRNKRSLNAENGFATI